ncbi:MAG: biotin/lipoyl-containing protein [Thermodesulfobacteriota bacterium]
MHRSINVDGETLALSVDSQSGDYAFSVDLGEGVRTIAAKSVTSNLTCLTIEGRSVNVFTAAGKDGTWVWVNGRARFVQDADRVPRRRSAGPGETSREVTPPTPAGVVRVLVDVGQRVEKKQPLVVVSAMKMEMTLSAPYAGVVRAVNTSVGAQVSPGDILVEIEPDTGESDAPAKMENADL